MFVISKSLQPINGAANQPYNLQLCLPACLSRSLCFTYSQR